MLKTTIALAALLLASTALTTNASAATAQILSDHCNCGPQPGGFGTVTATQVGTGVIDVSVNLINGNTFSGGGFPLAFGFNLTGNQTITYSLLSPNFVVANGTGPGGLTQTAGAFGVDGFGRFEYGVDYTGSGSSGNPPSTLSFRITDGATLTLASFAELSKNPPGDTTAFFVLDIFSGTTRNTGAVDVSGNGQTPFDITPVPLPPAIPLFIAGMVGIGMLRRAAKKRLSGNESNEAIAA
jgi:hypothetical protein